MISLGLIGYPLAHSYSPRIHKAALNFYGLQGNYTLYTVKPKAVQELKALLDCVKSGELAGLNVTIPHKQTIIPFLDELTPAAQAIGAVNTIFCNNNQLFGDNTDAPGFFADLIKQFPSFGADFGKHRSALIIGAGGAARAVAYALFKNSWKISIAARRPEQSQVLIAQFSGLAANMTVINYDENAFNNLHESLDLIVNATPLGMTQNNDVSPWPLGLPLPPRAAVYDLVYHPRVTKFIKDARAAGLNAISGLGMLVEQAAQSFKIWTGFSVPREILFAAVEEK